MLPGPRLFRSRWATLLWTGGILWAVADMAGGLTGGRHPAAAGTPTPAPDPDVATLVNALG